MVTLRDRRLLMAMPVAAIGLCMAWLVTADRAETQQDLTLHLASTAPTEPTLPAKLEPAAEAADLDRISLSRQSFSRGGLGSRALMTFTVRNANAYDIKDLEILCAFRSRDGRYSTERRRVLTETIGPKRRKAFPMTHVGYVNVKAERARCAPVMASRA